MRMQTFVSFNPYKTEVMLEEDAENISTILIQINKGRGPSQLMTPNVFL
jgi:hypothetical protein